LRYQGLSKRLNSKNISAEKIFMRKTAYILIIFFTVIIAYQKSAKVPFLFDDTDLIINNPQIKNFNHINKILTSDFFEQKQTVQGKGIGYYRPVVILSYMLDYKIWGLNAKGFHYTNILLHSINSVLLFLIIFFLCDDLFFSFCCGLIFSVHPVQSESVIWISGRTDLFGVLFFFSSFYLYLLYKNKKNKTVLALSLLFYAFGVLSKEFAIILPALLLCFDYIYSEKKDKTIFLNYPLYSYFLIGFSYFILRKAVLNISNPFFNQGSALDRVYTFIFSGIPYYFSKLVFPYNLNVYIDFQIQKFRLSNLIILILAICACMFFLKKYYNKISSLAVLFICFLIISIIPFSNVLPFSLAPDSEISVAERFLYLTSSAFCFLIARIIFLFKRVFLRKTIVILTVISYIVLLNIRITDWLNEETLLSKSLKNYPDSKLMLNKLGDIYENRGKFKEAMIYYEKVYLMNYRYIGVNNNIGAVYMKTGDYDKALKYFEDEIFFNGENAVVYNNMGLAFFYKNMIRESLANFSKALQIYPGYCEAYNNTGVVFASINKTEEAERFFNYALSISPDYEAPKKNLGLLRESVRRNYSEK